MKSFFRLLLTIITLIVVFNLNSQKTQEKIIGLTTRIAPHLGVMLCFGFSAFGTIKGMKTIANAVSGGSILVPRIGAKSCFGIVFCEANFLCGILMSILLHNMPAIKTNTEEGLSQAWMLFACGALVGICSYCSSISTGIICAAICIMDAKDPTLFMKLVVLELFSSSIGVLGFVIGMILREKASQFT